MRKLSLVFFVAIVLTLSVFLLFTQAGDKKSKGTTITGTLVDLKCYSQGGFLSNDHRDMKGNPLKSCGTMCAMAGLPVGIVDKDRNVHVLGVPANAYANWVGRELRVSGMKGKYADVFIPMKLELKENGKWVQKELPKTMM